MFQNSLLPRQPSRKIQVLGHHTCGDDDGMKVFRTCSRARPHVALHTGSTPAKRSPPNWPSCNFVCQAPTINAKNSKIRSGHKTTNSIMTVKGLLSLQKVSLSLFKVEPQHKSQLQRFQSSTKHTVENTCLRSAKLRPIEWTN